MKILSTFSKVVVFETKPQGLLPLGNFQASAFKQFGIC